MVEDMLVKLSRDKYVNLIHVTHVDVDQQGTMHVHLVTGMKVSTHDLCVQARLIEILNRRTVAS